MLLLHHFAVEYAIRTFQVSQNGFKLNSTHQLLVAAGDVSILGRCINTIKKKVEVSVVAIKESGLEGDTEKCKYVDIF